MSSPRRGIFWATVTYLLWGVTPVYWKFLKRFPAEDLVAYRILMSAICLLPIYFRKNMRAELKQVFRQKWLGIGLVFLSATLIGLNWYTVVFAVISGRVLDCSLGYFMTPLMSVLVGVAFLSERLTRLQGIAVAFAALGVTLFTAQLGQLPVMALFLSLTFALYGYLKKKIQASGILTVSLETLILTPFALSFLLTRGVHPHSIRLWCLLLASGPLTAVPLIWFVWALQDVPFTVAGFLQYLSPVLQFGLAVYFYREPFDLAQKLVFALIWFALALFSWDVFRRYSLQDLKDASSD